MYIQPNTDIYLLSNVPLDTTYEHTLYFADATSQYNTFRTRIKYNLSNYSFQRVTNGVLRVGIKSDLLYDCNYMMFRNSSFGSKWFYAFIKSVDYVNNETSEITFEIDFMQSWYFEYELKQCFIERQHSVTDVLYENYEPEPLDTGDMVLRTEQSAVTTLDWDDWCLVICCAPLNTGAGTTTLVRKLNGVISCGEYYQCNNNATSVVDFIDNVLPDQSQDSILSAYMFPKVFVDVGNPEDTKHIIDRYQDRPNVISFEDLKEPTDIDGYKPKNMKLYNSPYVLYEVTDDTGNAQFYKPEFFSGKPQFDIIGTFVGTPQMLVVPKNYRGNPYNYEEGFTITDFPMVAFDSDTFRAWLAQNQTANQISLLSSLGTAGVGIATGNPLLIASGAFGTAQKINQISVASNMPNKLVTRDSSGVLTCMYQKRPKFKVKTVTKLYARMIDDYFTKYGYAQGIIDTPNTHARPHFTYIKTNDCTIVSKCPADDARKIAETFDKGITFWVNIDEVGDYSVKNHPV